MKNTHVDVALVSMPWGPVGEPALGLSILKSCLKNNGISSRVFHLAPRLLHWLTIETYELIAGSWGINEFIFTGEIDPAFDGKQQDQLLAYAEKYLVTRQYPHPKYKTMEDIYELVMRLRTEIAPQFLDESASRILSCSPRLVGFTCMFDQTLASIALAKRLKQQLSTLLIVLGGYALEGPPGATVEKSFPWIDTIVVGDGEEEIVKLAREATEDLTRPPDLSRTGKLRVAQRIDMASSPVPEYDDWFRDIQDLAKDCSIQIKPKALPVESSRGCWWGQVKHCVFCGIDDETLRYRYKPAEQTLAMLETLRNKHGDYLFRFSDYILPKAYYSELLPRLAAYSPKFRLHCEIKANHPPERVQLLADAGFVEFQPGIESFSTAVLKEMDKGVRAVDNVSLLKAGYINGILVDYNLLYGMPVDEPKDYEYMLTMVPRIYHLSPPVSRTHTVITRFAPLQLNPARFGLSQPSHNECYDVLFSQEFLAASGFAYDEFAYYFRRQFEYSQALATLYGQLVLQVEHWKNLHRQRFVELSYSWGQDELLRITDSRFGETQNYKLAAPASAVYSVLDTRPVRRDVAHQKLQKTVPFSEREFTQALAQLEEHRLVWQDGDTVLGLAVPAAVSERHKTSQWPRQWSSIYV